jgi:hypothetical protein
MHIKHAASRGQYIALKRIYFLKQEVKVIQRAAAGRDLSIARGLEDLGCKTRWNGATV